MGCEQSGFWPWGAIGEQEAGGCSPVLRPPGVLPSPSPPAPSSLPPTPLLQPAEPQEEPWGCCVSCSSSEFYSAPLTLADRPQGMGQKDNCLQQFCPQLVSPSAFRAAQPASYWLTNIIKFNSRRCEREEEEEIKLLGASSFLSMPQIAGRSSGEPSCARGHAPRPGCAGVAVVLVAPSMSPCPVLGAGPCLGLVAHTLTLTPRLEPAQRRALLVPTRPPRCCRPHHCAHVLLWVPWCFCGTQEPF